MDDIENIENSKQMNLKSKIKYNQFLSDLSNGNYIEKKIRHLSKIEFEEIFSDILILSNEQFLSQIKNGISLSLSDIYSPNCLSHQEIIFLIENCLKLINTEYINIYNTLSKAWSNHEKNLRKKSQSNEELLKIFRKHCINNDEYAYHNCDLKNNTFLMINNNSFEEVAQVHLNKGERETLYLDLKGRTKIKIAIMLIDSDVDEKVNFFFTGPNARGHNIVIKQYYSKNFLFWEYETLYPGEYYAEITNKGTKENEILFLFHDDIASEKKDTINNEKIDKISMMLNNIDNNINQLRNKKKIEIKQVNSHNKKVTENNKWIVIYSIIEICTMILVFMMQSCYINSMIDKV